MKKTLVVSTFIILGMVSCKKSQTCIGRDKFGNALFETEGSAQCEKNINTANGEYCDCNGKKEG